MDVALATGAVARPFNFMTPRVGDVADDGGSPQPVSTDSKADPLTNRYPMIAFSYDVDASRLVMLYRDPANGKTVSQIPTETALKQYKEAQRQEKVTEKAAALKLTIGGGASGNTGGYASSDRDGAAGSNAVSSGQESVAHFTPSTTTHAAAVAVAGVGVGGGSSGTAARVNVVI